MFNNTYMLFENFKDFPKFRSRPYQRNPTARHFRLVFYESVVPPQSRRPVRAEINVALIL